MVQGRRWSRQELHEKLFERADRLGRVQVNLKDFSDETGITYSALSRILDEMVETGRMKVVAGSRFQRKTYFVTDPAEFVPPYKPPIIVP